MKMQGKAGVASERSACVCEAKAETLTGELTGLPKGVCCAILSPCTKRQNTEKTDGQISHASPGTGEAPKEGHHRPASVKAPANCGGHSVNTHPWSVWAEAGLGLRAMGLTDQALPATAVQGTRSSHEGKK